MQASLRTKSPSFQPLADYVRGERLNLDGAKGPPLSFRAWDNQLRQPILLATHDAVVARAPVRGFLHDRNDLDTLGYDAPETECALAAKVAK